MSFLATRGVLAVVMAGLVPAACLVGACQGKEAAGGGDAAAVIDVGHLDEPFHPDASCLVTIETPPLLPAAHVPIPDASITWSSNPPSSGPHFPIWAAYQTYQTPVDFGYLVHNLEHGAVLLLYRCADGGGCPEVVKALESVVAALPNDPICTDPVRVRAIVAPDPDLDVPIAAAAWGWTYKAECVDLPTLTDFARTHYGQGPEQICSQGQSVF